jgi:hypothetical protein
MAELLDRYLKPCGLCRRDECQRGLFTKSRPAAARRVWRSSAPANVRSRPFQ